MLAIESAIPLHLQNLITSPTKEIEMDSHNNNNNNTTSTFIDVHFWVHYNNNNNNNNNNNTLQMIPSTQHGTCHADFLVNALLQQQQKEQVLCMELVQVWIHIHQIRVFVQETITTPNKLSLLTALQSPWYKCNPQEAASILFPLLMERRQQQQSNNNNTPPVKRVQFNLDDSSSVDKTQQLQTIKSILRPSKFLTTKTTNDDDDNDTSSSSISMSNVRPHDVLCGPNDAHYFLSRTNQSMRSKQQQPCVQPQQRRRRSRQYRHAGNIRYHHLIYKGAKLFGNKSTRVERIKMAHMAIVAAQRAGSRFLMFCTKTGRWNIMSQEKALEKTFTTFQVAATALGQKQQQQQLLQRQQQQQEQEKENVVVPSDEMLQKSAMLVEQVLQLQHQTRRLLSNSL